LKLIHIPVHKIIFIEEEIYNTYFKNYQNDYTIYIFIKKKDLYLYEYKDLITQFHINTTNPNKDTIDYIFVQCNKTEWIKQAIELNIHSSDYFIWIDFGIYHIIQNDSAFYDAITQLQEKEHSSIRIAGGHPVDRDIYEDDYIYKNVAWKFLGGIFGGHKDTLLLFAELTKQKCVETIQTKGTLPWEVNIWYMIYQENPQLFNIYLSDHNLSMIKDY
jgi:hypothetical protein